MVLEMFRAHFGRGIAGLDRFTAELGAEVFERGAVGPVSESTPGCLQAQVQDAEGVTRHTQVALSAHGALSRFSSTCDCAIGTDCEHGAAVLLAWLTQVRQSSSGRFPGRPGAAPGTAPRAADSDELSSDDPQDASTEASFNRLRALAWVRKLRDLPAPLSGPPKRAASVVWWVLDMHAQPPSLTPHRAHLRADGGVEGLEPCRPPVEHAMAAHAGWDEADARAWRLLAGASQHHSAMELGGAYAQDALLGLVSAGRVYLDEAAPLEQRQALQRGPHRSAQLAWLPCTEAPGAARRLSLHVHPPAQALLLAQPCWIDPSTRQIGPLADPPPPALIEWLRAAPAVAAQDADEVAHALHALHRARPALHDWVPSVPESAVRERLGQPTPVVGVFEVSTGEAKRLAISCAVEYEGRRTEPLRNTTLSLRDEAGPILLVCDSAQEQVAIETLRTALGPLGGPHDALALTPAGPASGSRGRIDTGWLTIATLPADSIAAARLRDAVLPELAARGWKVLDNAPAALTILDAEHLDLALHSAPSTTPAGPSLGGMPRWFALQSGIRIGARHIDLAPLLAEAVAAGSLAAWLRQAVHQGKVWWRVSAHEVLRIDAARLVPLLEVMAHWLDTAVAVPDAPPRLHPLTAARLAAALPELPVPEALRPLHALLAPAVAALPCDPPAAFAATLRPYQKAGLGWLQAIAASGTGGVLADDMGLGKTVQVLAHLALERAAGRLRTPALVIAPTSVIFNWQQEAARHAPELRVLALVGPEREALRTALSAHDVVLTSWALLPRDAEILLAQSWHAVIADEAHCAKNPRTRASRVLRGLQAQHRLALTGTPLENHLGELWAIMAFAVPGLLGSEEQFRARFRQPIERGTDAALHNERLSALEQRIAPFLLRRTKSAVLADLPPCTEIIYRVELHGPQRDLYESLRATMDERVRDALREHGAAGSRIVVLDALLKMRQACCDPTLLKLPAAQGVRQSAKLDALRELLSTLTAEGRRVLVFSQFTSMLDRIEHALDADPALAQVPRARLDGHTEDRRGAVQAFQEGPATLFLLSLKAGGVGLNLTRADTVIHFDPWWNPAVEAQATDRARRIGQHKPVFVYKLITTATIEERILALQQSKAGLAKAVLEGPSAPSALETEALLSLLEAP